MTQPIKLIKKKTSLFQMSQRNFKKFWKNLFALKIFELMITISRKMFQLMIDK